MEPRGSRPRIALTRLGPAIALAAGAMALAGIGGSRAVLSAIRWEHHRTSYEHDFRDTLLVPEPPRWIRVGREGLLKGVLERSRQPGRASVLDRDLAKLDAAFRNLCPWIEEVIRVERAYPNRVTVRVGRYREPVARIPIGGGASIVLDGRGVVLPEEELDEEAARPLIRLDGLPSPATADALAGRALKFPDPGEGDPRADRRVEDAARLAAFLKARMTGTGPEAPPFVAEAIRPAPGRGLWIWTAAKFYIFWGEAPGAEPVGRPAADRKWEHLLAWFDGRPRPAVLTDQYLDASGDRILLVDFPRQSAGGSAAAASRYQRRRLGAQGASTRR